MKRRTITVLLALLLVFCIGGTAMASSDVVEASLLYRGVNVRLNGETLFLADELGNGIEPFIIDGTTYLPIRAVAGALGLEVSWDGDTSTVVLKSGGEPSRATGESLKSNRVERANLLYRDIKITLDGKELIPRDSVGSIVEPFIIGGTTYLPIRAIAGALGLEVNWYGMTSTVTLRSPGQPDYTPVDVTLTGSGPDEILALLDVPNLAYVNAMASTCYPELMQLRAAQPGCVIDYYVDLGGIAVGSREESANIDGKRIPVNELQEKLQYLPALKKLHMCNMGYKNEQSLQIVNAYPNIDVVWTVNFAGRSARSDVQVYSTLHADEGEARYSTEQFWPLFQYCTDLVALDLGHNALVDLQPLTNLKKLKVLILGDNPYLDDISPLGELTNLEYLEMFRAYHVKDFSPLNNLTNMVDLNLCYCLDLQDISFLDYMPNLKMFWCRSSGITYSSPKTCNGCSEKYPDATFMFYSGRAVSSFSLGWRATDRNVAIREAFTNWQNVEVFNGWDDVKYVEGAYIKKAKPQDWW